MEINENKTAFVTKRLLETNLKVGFAYKEKPDNENDSGWRFFVGDENQEYVDNPNNLAILSIKEILEKDKSIEEILNSEYNTAFIKEDLKFKQISDFNFNANEGN